MLQRLPDECKEQVWSFFDAQELCRVACVARYLESGVSLRLLWRRRALALLQDEQERMHTRTGLLGHRLQRGFASRNLLSSGEAPSANVQRALNSLVDDGTMDWRLWYRDTHKCIVEVTSTNTGFTTGVNELQELKTERAALKEALQVVKSSSHADKRARRVEMHCVRWMNRSHRRRSAAASSQQAQRVSLSKAELMEELQAVEETIKTQGKELFSLRSRALKSLHRLNTQLAVGVRILDALEDDTADQHDSQLVV